MFIASAPGHLFIRCVTRYFRPDNILIVKILEMLIVAEILLKSNWELRLDLTF
jgi:hypothetical protein